MKKTRSRLFPALAGTALTLTLALSGCAGGNDSAQPAASDVTTSAVSISVDAASLRGHVDAATFLAAIQDPAVTVVDVRTPEEYAAGHLPNAININVESPTFIDEISALDPEGIYALYCRSSNRSRTAEETMLEEGFSQVFDLDGGVTVLDPSELVTN